MTTAHWFTQHERGGFPIEKAALGSCDLSILHVGGEWQWLVRQAGRDVAEGAARTADDARRAAEAVATGRMPWGIASSRNCWTTASSTASCAALASADTFAAKLRFGRFIGMVSGEENTYFRRVVWCVGLF